MNGHFLVEMAHMLYRISSPIINGESWLGKVVREFSLINLARKRRLGNLT